MSYPCRILLASVLVACVGGEPPCNIESGAHCPLEVLQLLVNDAEPDDPISGLSVSYGVVKGFHECDDPNDPTICPSGTSCQGAFGRFGLKGCVDASGRFPIARSAPTSGLELRVVFDVLLDGRSVEQFGCDCTATGGTCAAGREYSIEPFDCKSCESGACLLDDNGLPSRVALLPGLATIRCGDFTYRTLPGDGGYFPSGNQFISVARGLAGLGPALIFTPSVTLPSDRDCSIELSDRIRTKSDVAPTQPSQPLGFHTQRAL